MSRHLTGFFYMTPLLNGFAESATRCRGAGSPASEPFTCSNDSFTNASESFIAGNGSFTAGNESFTAGNESFTAGGEPFTNVFE